MLFLSSSFPSNNPRWVYDDPSGVDERPRPDRRPTRHGHRDAIRDRRHSFLGMVS
jgi:hypothetical protein